MSTSPDNAPSTDVRLYGTEQPPATPRVLRAGSLSAELEAGNLRHLRLGDVELIRAVSFVVRDKDWGTYEPEIDGLEITETDGAFTVGYDAVAREGERTFRWRARIEGDEHAVRFSAEGESDSGFTTNRTGFVVLHALAGVAGEPVRIEHVDGGTVDGRFPGAIDPVQPMRELRALTHEPVKGLRVNCRMEGDTYEMEDQRNWTDASYKTYVRPLARPWPYEIEPGERLGQSVTVSVERAPGAATVEGGGTDAVTIRLGDESAALPAIGVGLATFDLALDEAPEPVLSALAGLGLDHVLCHHDPRRGDGPESLARHARTAARLQATPWLEAVVVGVDDPARELDELGALAADLESAFATVLVSPASDMKGTLPGSEWPPAPDAEALYAATRHAFPNARIGGGMFSFFTELNRKRPPTDALDAVCFTTAAIVHAGDDVTVMENLEAIPYVVATAADIAHGLPLVIGPSAIGMRLNPYGKAPMENPTNIRQAMNRVDPRQRGSMNAAWLVGYAAAAASESVEALTFGTATGAHGLVHVSGEGEAPYYEEHGGVYPGYHVVRQLARFAGHPRRAAEVSAPTRVACLFADIGGTLEALVANLGPSPTTIEFPRDVDGARVLDADVFVAAATEPAWLDSLDPFSGRTLALDAFAVARIALA